MNITLSSHNSALLEEKIKAEAYDLGFVAVGFCNPDSDNGYAHYLDWLESGMHASMFYLARPDLVKRKESARSILPDCQTVISLAFPYLPPDQQHPLETQGGIAAYALVRDYHLQLTQKANSLSEEIEELAGIPVRSQVCVDTAPILEKGYAQQAGLGWIGRNSLLLHPDYGSFLFLAEVLIDLPLEPDSPFILDGCGSCQRCVQACPTQAIMPDRSIDARRCLSFLTIENRSEIPSEFRRASGNRVFGCDTCQIVCPYNARLPKMPAQHEFEQVISARPELAASLVIKSNEFSDYYGKTPVTRAKLQGFRRNAAIAIGNSSQKDFVPLLEKALVNESDPIVADALQWALNELNS